MSHELRTPLTAVAGFAESLADGVVTGDGVPAAVVFDRGALHERYAEPRTWAVVHCDATSTTRADRAGSVRAGTAYHRRSRHE